MPHPTSQQILDTARSQATFISRSDLSRACKHFVRLMTEGDDETARVLLRRPRITPALLEAVEKQDREQFLELLSNITL